MSLRVATLNLWGRSGAWADRRAVLAEGLHKLAAAVRQQPAQLPARLRAGARAAGGGHRLLEVDGERPVEAGRRIDHIMVRCHHHGPTLDVVACERSFDQPVDGVRASDHFGVVADLEVP